jgi:hypothetical protein
MRTKKTKAGESADRYRRQLTQVIAKLGDEELLRLVAGAEPLGFVKPGPPPGGDRFKASYQAALPFEIHESDDASPFLHQPRVRAPESEQCSRLYGRIVNLSEYEGTMADQALQAGLRVSIKCSPDFAPDIAGAFAQRVPSRTLVFYDDEGKRLVFRHESEEAIHDKQESEEK